MKIDEKREHKRLPLRRPAKVYDGRSRKYTSCLTVDVSQGGALIEMKHRIPVSPGVHLMLGVAATDSQGLVHAERMLEVEVVRALNFDIDRQFLAVRFVHARDVSLNTQAIAA